MKLVLLYAIGAKALQDMAIAGWACVISDWRLALMFFGFAVADVGAYAIAEVGR